MYFLYIIVAALQTATVVLISTFVQCVAIAVYLQFTRTQETLDTDFCFCMQPWLLMIALVIGLTYPTIWLNRCVSLANFFLCV
jgi:hypothetical protein